MVKFSDETKLTLPVRNSESNSRPLSISPTSVMEEEQESVAKTVEKMPTDRSAFEIKANTGQKSTVTSNRTADDLTSKL